MKFIVTDKMIENWWERVKDLPARDLIKFLTSEDGGCILDYGKYNRYGKSKGE